MKKDAYFPLTYMWEVEAPDAALVAQLRHLLMVQMSKEGEQIALLEPGLAKAEPALGRRGLLCARDAESGVSAGSRV